MTVLEHAFNQWASRPADQRFSSLDDLHTAVTNYRNITVEATNVDLRQCRIAVGATSEQNGTRLLTPGERPTHIENLEPVIVGPAGEPATFTHWSFGQVCRRLEAPASYLRTLTPQLAVANLSHGLKTVEETHDNLLFARNGGLRLRRDVSQQYTEIKDVDITSRLIRLSQHSPEWQPAPAAFDGSRGLYASDSDLFAFLVDNDRRIFESAPGGGLARGFFVSNSEVGAMSFKVTTFLYEFICGNHRVWGVKGVKELKIRHVGNADERAFSQLEVELKSYADSSARDDEAKVQACRAKILGATKDEVLDAVFGLNTGLTKAQVAKGYAVAVQEEDKYGNPNSVWGFTGGLTQVARDLKNTSDRVALEAAAGKVLSIAF